MEEASQIRRALIILCHPDAQSFNHALAEVCATALKIAGFSVTLKDLYAEAFDPVITKEEVRGERTNDLKVLEHIALLKSSDVLVVIHPNCWGSPPAMMKGWMDRVFALNSAYSFEKETDQGDTPKGLLTIKTAIVFNTSNTTAERERDHFGDPLERIWKDCVLQYCGVPSVIRRVFRVIATSSLAQRRLWLEEAQDVVVQSVSMNHS
jgi:putative NADPH-quinone reductase